MGQVSAFLRRTTTGYAHWCPGCRELHVIPDSWQFDGKLDRPTFTPSVAITGVQTVVDDRGEWTGEWVRGPDGQALPYCCHYILTAGVLAFQPDCTHALKGKSVPLPRLPSFVCDPIEKPSVNQSPKSSSTAPVWTPKVSVIR